MAVVLAAVTAVASSARAAPERVASASWELAEGPLLAGSAIVWREQLCLEACGPQETSCNQVYRYRVRIAPPPGRRALVAGDVSCADSGPSYSYEEVRLAVSAGRMLFAESSSRGDEFVDLSDAELLAGPLAGPLERLTACEADHHEGGGADLVYALDGDLAAFDPSPCDGSPDLEVRDLADRSARSIPLEGTTAIRDLAVAGSLVAAVRASDVVEVYDVHGGGLVYTASPPGPRPFGVQLAPDGRIAASFAAGRGHPCGPASVWLARPQEPSGRVMPIRACSEVRLVDAGMVYLAPGPRHRPAGLKLLGFDGRERTIVRFSKNVSGAGAFDARGELAAYGLRGCGGTMDLYRVAIGGPAVAAQSPRCTARMVGRALISYPGGRLRVPVRCPNGCAGKIVVRHRGKLVGARPFSVASRGRAIVLRLRSHGRRLLRRTPHLELVVELEIADSRAGRTSTVRRRFTPRPVRELPGGRSSEAAFLVDPVVTYLGRRAAGVCYDIGYYTSEVDGESRQVYGEGGEFDRCRRRSRPLRVPAGGQVSVRTPKEATGVALADATGDPRDCRRRVTGVWRCELPSAPTGRRELRLTVRYPEAEANFQIVVRLSQLPRSHSASG